MGGSTNNAKRARDSIGSATSPDVIGIVYALLAVRDELEKLREQLAVHSSCCCRAAEGGSGSSREDG